MTPLYHLHDRSRVRMNDLTLCVFSSPVIFDNSAVAANIFTKPLLALEVTPNLAAVVSDKLVINLNRRRRRLLSVLRFHMADNI